MKTLENANPIVTFMYFLCVFFCVMFSIDPFISALSLMCSLIFAITKRYLNNKKENIFYIIIFILMTVLNPLFNHRGNTVFFYINDNAITLEALLYGLSTAAMIMSVIIWFKCFGKIMTEDKIIYVFGRIWPGFALMISSIMRFVSLYTKQWRVISDSRKAMGENETGNIISSIKNGISTFMIMITWALEHGAQTAESMDGRGYNTTRRTSYSKYFFHISDALVIMFYLMFALLVILTSVINGVGFSFYPDMVMKGNIYYRILIYSAFLILCLMPTILEIGDEIKWHRLKLKI